MNLAQKKCVPCTKDAHALAPEQTHALLGDLPGWSISADGKWLSKRFKFSNFMQALAYVNKIAPIAEAENHHPDILLGWGYVEVRLQTHTLGGLHENDFILAAKIENV